MTSLDKTNNFNACINAFLFIVQQLFLSILSFYGNEIRIYFRIVSNANDKDFANFVRLDKQNFKWASHFGSFSILVPQHT